MNYSIFDRFPFSRDGNANRRDKDADPRVLIVDAAHYLEVNGFRVSEVIVHFAGDEYTRVVPIAEAAELVEDMAPGDAYWMGRAIEGADVAIAEGEL